MANIISALVTQDWLGVVSQCTTDSWKEAFAATLTHAQAETPHLCERLGERLQSESEGNVTFLQNAILCYICAGNVEKLVEIWPSLNLEQSESITDLQDLVEIVMLLQKALELQGRNTEATGKLADLLSRYAGLLAAQGALSSALTYLLPSEDPQLTDLRDRLAYTLGHKQAYQVRASQAHNQYHQSQQNNRFAQSRQSFPNTVATAPQQPMFNSGLPGQQPQQNGLYGQPPAVQQPWATQATAGNAWNSPPAAVQQTPFVPPPSAAAKPPIAPVASSALPQPPRPSSVGSQGSGPSRSKYILDPSVQSGPAYGQNNLYNPMLNQTNSFNSQPPLYPNQNNYNSNFSSQPAVAQPQPNQFVPFTPAPLVNNDYLPGVQPIELAQPAMSMQYQKNPTPPPGWNDPPPLKTSRQPVCTFYLFHLYNR